VEKTRIAGTGKTRLYPVAAPACHTGLLTYKTQEPHASGDRNLAVCGGAKAEHITKKTHSAYRASKLLSAPSARGPQGSLLCRASAR
jgi:hypothetical protein